MVQRRRPRSLRRTVTDVAVFLSVLLIVVLVMDRLGMFPGKPQEISVHTYQVIDGDSLRNADTEIRLVGIDAPEYRQSCNDARGKTYPCGKDAASALRQLISGADVQCESHAVDRYRRALATCRVAGTIVNREMVLQGWALAFALRGGASEYALDELEARRMKRGIWQGQFETPSEYRKRQRAVQSDAAGADEPDD